MATPLNLSIASPRHKVSSSPLFPQRNLNFRPTISALSSSHGDSSPIGFSSRASRLPSKIDQNEFYINKSSGVIEAKNGNPPIMPAVMTPVGPLDLSTVLFRNRMIFVGPIINSDVAQRVISQLVTLAAIDEESDILLYVNSQGGSPYSVFAIYDCMSWIKPKVGTVCFGIAGSHAALLLAGGQKGMRYAMPNSRIMINQPYCGCGGHVDTVNRDVEEGVYTRQKIARMYAAFTGQPYEKLHKLIERDRYMSVGEAMDFGLIDGILETEY